MFKKTILTGQYVDRSICRSTYWPVNGWTGQYPILAYTTWRDLNQSQPHISIRGITIAVGDCELKGIDAYMTCCGISATDRLRFTSYDAILSSRCNFTLYAFTKQTECVIISTDDSSYLPVSLFFISVNQTYYSLAAAVTSGVAKGGLGGPAPSPKWPGRKKLKYILVTLKFHVVCSLQSPQT